MTKGRHEFHDEQKLVFTMHKFSQMVSVRAKKDRECRRKESYTFCHYLNVRYDPWASGSPIPDL